MSMANPNPKIHWEIADAKKFPRSPAKTETGKFIRDVRHFKRSRVPKDLLELFDWYNQLNTKEVNYLLELKNMYNVLKDLSIKTVVQKMESGKNLNQTEINQFRLLIDIMDKSHKLKYGDKKVIERVVSIEDIRKQMISDKKIIQADFDDSGSG